MTDAASVLVADDDPTSRMLVGAALQGHVGKVVEAANGSLALEALETNCFDIAIMDLQMPVMDGFGFIEGARARTETRHLPIIVVTGRDDIVAIERAFALGATSFLCKPINWSVFRHQVGYVLNVARAEREMRVARERAERVASFRNRVIAALENEIRNAAGAISGFVQAASGTFPDEAALASIAASGKRLATAHGRVTRVSQIAVGAAGLALERVRATDLAADAIAGVENALGAEAAGRVERDIAGELELFCDRRLAAEALNEVLQNALIYSPASQKVSLRAVEVPPDRLRFEIEDRGPGIPEQILADGLEDFGPLRDGSGSSPAGLGIAVAKIIVERHGGHFGIMSEIGRGSEVFLSFPTFSRDHGDEKLNRIAPSSAWELSQSEHASAS